MNTIKIEQYFKDKEKYISSKELSDLSLVRENVLSGKTRKKANYRLGFVSFSIMFLSVFTLTSFNQNELVGNSNDVSIALITSNINFEESYKIDSNDLDYFVNLAVYEKDIIDYYL